MIAISYLKYEYIYRKTEMFATVVILVTLLASTLGIKGRISYVASVGSYGIRAYTFMLLFVPIFGMLVYKKCREHEAGVLRALVWLMIALFVLKLGCSLVPLAILLPAVLLIFLVNQKGWIKKYGSASVFLP